MDDAASGLDADVQKQIAHHLHGEHFNRGDLICGGDGDLVEARNGMERFIDTDGEVGFNGVGYNGGGDDAGSPDAKKIDVMNSRWGGARLESGFIRGWKGAWLGSNS